VNRFLIMATVVSMMVACSGTTAPDEGDNTPPYTVSGVFGVEGWTVRGSFSTIRMNHTYISLVDSSGLPISGATVRINGFSIPEVDPGTYRDTVNVLYVAGHTYDLEISIDSSRYLEATITAPEVDSVRPVGIAAGDTLPYDSVAISWQVFGTPSGQLLLIVQDTFLELDNDLTSYTLDSSLVLEAIRGRDGTMNLGVAYLNRLDFVELLEESGYMVGTYFIIPIHVDTTR